jgi:hypothetical protein
MNRSDHERARDLIMMRDVEEISGSDVAWLTTHLSECVSCAEFAEALRLTTLAMRSQPVTASFSLARTTQLLVRQRAAQLRERSMRNFLIAITFCLGVLSSATATLLWWRFGSFIADRVGLPMSMVQPALFIASTLPAVIIAVFMLATAHPVIDRSVTMALLAEREGGRK